MKSQDHPLANVQVYLQDKGHQRSFQTPNKIHSIQTKMLFPFLQMGQ